MSAVIADPAAAGGAVPVKRGKKKLLVMVAAILVVVLGLGAGTVVVLKKKAHAAAEAAATEDDGGTMNTTAANAEAASHDALAPPTYLPLDPFVVNLADKDADRYAQVGITLEVDSTPVAEQMRAYMPSIRNAILMVITRKTSRELLDSMGKEQLADEIAREAVRPMGIEIAAPQPVTAAPDAMASGAAKAKAAATPIAKKKGVVTRNPIRHVHFSSFIIQ